MYTEAMCNFCSFLHASKTSCPFLIVSILWKLKIERYFLDILYYFCKYKRSDGLHRIGYNRIIHLPDHLILWTVTGTVDAGRISGTQPVSISVLDFVSYGIELQQGDSVFTAERSIGVHFVGFRHFPTWTIKIIGIEQVLEQWVAVNIYYFCTCNRYNSNLLQEKKGLMILSNMVDYYMRLYILFLCYNTKIFLTGAVAGTPWPGGKKTCVRTLGRSGAPATTLANIHRTKELHKIKNNVIEWCDLNRLIVWPYIWLTNRLYDILPMTGN